MMNETINIQIMLQTRQSKMSLFHMAELKLALVYCQIRNIDKHVLPFTGTVYLSTKMVSHFKDKKKKNVKKKRRY